MDILQENSHLHTWLIHYGSFALFFLLTLGILALPVPEETLMVLAGVLMHQGQLCIPQTMFAAYLGSLCGISLSYWIGHTAGLYLIERYGKWVGIGPKEQERAHQWFERFGKWTLFFGYFIPGVRHFTGLTAGITSLTYLDFALFAYSGAIVWVSVFLSIGYFFGNYWTSLFEKIESNLENVIIAAIVGLLFFLIYRSQVKK